MTSRRRRVLDKLGEVSAKIEQLLAGQDVELSTLPLQAEPGETPLERLRRFKALLQETLNALQRREAPRCQRCGGPIADAMLDELPWATGCGRCPG